MSKNSPPPQNLVYKDKKFIFNIHNYNIIARATHSGVPKQKSSPRQRHCSNCTDATATRLKCHSERKRGNPLNRNANLNGVLPRASLVLAITTAQKIFAIISSRDKNPATVSQDCLLGVGVLRTQVDKRKLIQSVLIHGVCLFKVRAARRREYERRA